MKKYTIESEYGDFDIYFPPFMYEKYDTGLQEKTVLHEKDEFNAYWKIRKYFLEHYTQDDVYLDIGANVGFSSIGLGKSGIKCLCFEPVKENLKYLNKSITENNLTENMKVFPYGLFNEDKSDVIYVPCDFPDNSSLTEVTAMNNVNQFMKTECEHYREEIKLVKFDSLDIPEKPLIKLVKIDVQGFEDEVLDGMRDFLSKTTQGTTFIIEIEERLLTKRPIESKIIQIMESYGFNSKPWGFPDYIFIK